jgi:hypothetical protein
MKSENNLKFLNLISLIIILLCLLYIQHLTFEKKNFELSNHPRIKDKSENVELLDMCLKSRKLIFSKVRNVNESNLVTIQNKLNYLIVHESPDFKTKVADKILLHDYSIKKLGKDICVPLIKIYNESKEILLEDLPNKFVLKCNHGSGMNIFCTNKSNFNK